MDCSVFYNSISLKKTSFQKFRFIWPLYLALTLPQIFKKCRDESTDSLHRHTRPYVTTSWIWMLTESKVRQQVVWGPEEISVDIDPYTPLPPKTPFFTLIDMK